MADTTDLKSVGVSRAGSSPALGTKEKNMNAEKKRLIYTWFTVYNEKQTIPEDSPLALTFDKALVLLRDVDKEKILDDIRFMRSGSKL